MARRKGVVPPPIGGRGGAPVDSKQRLCRTAGHV